MERYTNKEVTHVLDPVMLLDASDYSEICGERLIEESYLLLYLPADDNSKLRIAAKDYAKANGLKIMEISTKLQEFSTSEMNCIGDAGIEEFLSAVRYADVVFTNSFHAICFAIIFHVQFYAFSRSYAGKVKDICDVFKLTNRFFPDNNFTECTELIDYKEVDEKWSYKKIISQNWLNSALSGGVRRILFLRGLYMIQISATEPFMSVA